MAERLRISVDLVTKGTNTVIEMMERELGEGEGSVFITGFGDIRPIYFPTSGKTRLRFFADPEWLRGLNAPIDENDLGLYRGPN